jgi:hypothetical protein
MSDNEPEVQTTDEENPDLRTPEEANASTDDQEAEPVTDDEATFIWKLGQSKYNAVAARPMETVAIGDSENILIVGNGSFVIIVNKAGSPGLYRKIQNDYGPVSDRGVDEEALDNAKEGVAALLTGMIDFDGDEIKGLEEETKEIKEEEKKEEEEPPPPPEPPVLIERPAPEPLPTPTPVEVVEAVMDVSQTAAPEQEEEES